VEIPTPAGLYMPENYSNRYAGPVSVRTALSSSLNVPAVRVLGLVGAEPFALRLRDIGFGGIRKDGEYYGWSLALGSADVTLWDLVTAYRALADGGRTGALSLLPAGRIPPGKAGMDRRAPLSFPPSWRTAGPGAPTSDWRTSSRHGSGRPVKNREPQGHGGQLVRRVLGAVYRRGLGGQFLRGPHVERDGHLGCRPGVAGDHERPARTDPIQAARAPTGSDRRDGPSIRRGAGPDRVVPGGDRATPASVPAPPETIAALQYRPRVPFWPLSDFPRRTSCLFSGQIARRSDKILSPNRRAGCSMSGSPIQGEHVLTLAEPRQRFLIQ
jgi:hypothetical protein